MAAVAISHTPACFFGADTNTKVSELWKQVEKILIDRNILWMKLLVSVQNVRKGRFLEVNRLNAHLMRVLRCHIEPVYCFSIPGRW